MNQRDFWAGQFGSEYIARNASPGLLSANLAFFSRILENFPTAPDRVLEIGANIGMNISALKLLLPQANFTGIEINSDAVKILQGVADVVIEGSVEETEITQDYDLVFTKGVLIHLDPSSLSSVYEKIYNSSNKWILFAEYYNPTPVGLEYRGHEDKLFKRDFSGEICNSYPDLELVSHGFAYHSGIFPQDDISWFLMRKKDSK